MVKKHTRELEENESIYAIHSIVASIIATVKVYEGSLKQMSKI